VNKLYLKVTDYNYKYFPGKGANVSQRKT